MPKYKGNAYLRLSYSADRSVESDSIANQKKLIEDFVAAHPDIELVSERVDDGYSGVLFDRPAFQEMMNDIVSGKINCVIVKDLSRLGREYIETGRYLRQVFPTYGVRFISINDGIDTANEQNGDDLHISLKNLLNDTYCRDISVKTRSALLTKRQNGDYVGACPIYGYRKDPENRNHLVIDEDAARVVRDIYRLRIDGASAKHIAEELNRLGVLSPMAYKDSRGLPHPTGGFADVPDAKWSARTVIRILQEETYTGVLLQGRQETHNHKLKNIIHKPAEEWVRIENAHEPIIQKRDFDLVQKISHLDTRTAPDNKTVYLFSGLLICGCCGARMTRKTNTVKGKKYVYYHCPTGKKKGCTQPVMLKEDDLTDCVLAVLQSHIQHIVSLDELLDSISEEQINQEEIAKFKTQIADNKVKLEEARQFKATLYENFIANLISKKDYQDLKSLYTERAEQAQEAIERLRIEMELVTNNSSSRLRWTQHFKEFSAMTTLDRRAVIATVQSIRVNAKDDLVITFRYQNEYVKVLKRLDRMEMLPPDLREVLDTLAAAEKEAA
ncbi:MAG: recombinase family protein [Oscillibacter sp.]|jgi:DNA invertase Pin-like site-specific DNA recombinase|nr:recombinase family protein [Oscillibacter sp.]